MRPVKRTEIMPLFGQREAVLKRFGTMQNAYDTMGDMVKPHVTSPYLLGKIMEGAYCLPEQAKAVEAALRHYVVEPRKILSNWLDEYLSGGLPDLTVREIMVLVDAIGAADEISLEGRGTPTSEDETRSEGDSGPVAA